MLGKSILACSSVSNFRSDFSSSRFEFNSVGSTILRYHRYHTMPSCGSDFILFKRLIMSRNYKFHNPKGVYFISFAVVDWLDVFIRDEYKDILIDSLHYCQKEKGMVIFSWCIMPNHVHLIFRIVSELLPEQVIGDLKRHTSKAIVKKITTNPDEIHKEQLLVCFKKAALKCSNVNESQFWQHDNHPLELWSPKVTQEKINYIHNNSVKAGIVFKPKDYIYSSARDYSGEKGLVRGVVLVPQFF